jgi:hypothetical protein
MVSLPFVLSVISAATSGVFAFLVLRRWWEKRRPHYMAWGIGLALYCLGTFSQVVLTFTWSPLFFGLWYWCGALMAPAWLGQGTVYLLWRKGNIARNINMALLLVGIMTLPWTLFLTTFNPSAWYPGADMTQIYRDEKDTSGALIHPGIMPGDAKGTVRFFSPIMNVWGTLALVGGAIYSAWIFRRKHIMRNRVVGNWFIAAGGLLPALGGALIRLGNPSFKYIAEMLGAILIFVGFWLATNVPDEVETRREVRQAAGD